MNIISVDVGWVEQTKRNAIAVANPGREIFFIAGGLGDGELARLVQEHSEPESLILLDVPIEGCENLCKARPRRPVERGLQHYLSLYPAIKARGRGKELEKRLRRAIPDRIRASIVFQEIYPYAVYKFLWFARQNGKLEKVRRGEWGKVLDESFIPSSSPPRYKGTKIEYGKRLDGMEKLYTFLTQHLDLVFSQPLTSPHSSLGRTKLELLADQYDACLGAVVGLYYVAGNPYAWVVGEERRGEILILADLWLKERLKEQGLHLRCQY